jgi:hypothetical protein
MELIEALKWLAIYFLMYCLIISIEAVYEMEKEPSEKPHLPQR